MRILLSALLILISSAVFCQNSSLQADDRIGVLKTVDDDLLGYAFVAMNKNVIFTAADNISFEHQMVFVTNYGAHFSVKVVATDPVGNIGVLMSDRPISEKPYSINLNFDIQKNTPLQVMSMDKNESLFETTTVSGKSSKMEKSKEFKFVDIPFKTSSPLSGWPILNAFGEVIGLASSVNLNNGETAIVKASIMDGQMWKKM